MPQTEHEHTPEERLELRFRAYLKDECSLEDLRVASRTASKQGLTAENSPMYKKVERFVKSIMGAMAMKDDLVIEGAASEDSITFKIFDFGGQKVCCDMRRMI